MRNNWLVVLLMSTYIFFGLCLPSCVSNGSYNGIKDESTAYDSITIEIQPTDQCDVQPEAIKKLVKYLDRYSFVNRRNIRIIRYPKVTVTRKEWSSKSLDRLTKKTRKIYDSNLDDRHLKVFLLCVPGNYKSSNGDLDSVAGLQRGDTEIILFRDRTAKSNAKVLLHEFGHVIGLVDRSSSLKRPGIPANPKRPNHCNNEKCIMHWICGDDSWMCKLCVRDMSRFIPNGRQ